MNWRFALWFAVFGSGLYLLALGVVFLFQDELVFQPEFLPSQHQFQLGQPLEEHFLTTSDGQHIHGLFIKSPTAGHRSEVVLYLHGNRDNLDRWVKYHEDFTRRGVDFFAIDYRGYGKSSGRPSEAGLYRDAQAAYDWLIDRGYCPEGITIYGRSLGSGVASQLASANVCRQLILETPYNSIGGVMESQIAGLAIPFEPHANFSNEAYLPLVDEPVTIFHGTDDWVVPYASARALQPVLKSGDRFLTLRGGDHHNLSSFHSYQLLLDALLRR